MSIVKFSFVESVRTYAELLLRSCVLFSIRFSVLLVKLFFESACRFACSKLFGNPPPRYSICMPSYDFEFTSIGLLDSTCLVDCSNLHAMLLFTISLIVLFSACSIVHAEGALGGTRGVALYAQVYFLYPCFRSEQQDLVSITFFVG